MTGDTMSAIQDLRRALTAAATACDSILYARLGGAREAERRLPRLLDQLIARANALQQALAREEGRR
jgi:DNA-binding transcriptional MocR family regulator